jgi:hypothetical protein
MGSSIRRIGFVVFLASSFFSWSCEKHHVGELAPEKSGGEAEHAAPAPGESPTPAEFFPSATPR